MKDENELERNITRELRSKVGNGFEWLEWSSSEEQVRKNLEEGEKVLLLPLGGFWIAYRKKVKK